MYCCANEPPRAPAPSGGPSRHSLTLRGAKRARLTGPHVSGASRFQFASEIPATAAEVWAWHSRPGAFERLTPPWEAVALLARSGPRLEDGLRVTLGVGPPPFRLRWVAEHRDCVPGRGFRDVQVSGPFALWSHHHEMRDAGDGSSVLSDDLSVALPLHRLLRPIAEPLLRRKLERLFRFRHAVTRGDLEAHAAHPGAPLRIGVGGGGPLATALRHFLTTGGHAVGPAEKGPAPLDAVVLVAGGDARDPALAEWLQRTAAAQVAPRLIVVGERLPPGLPRGAGRVQLHLGHLVWPGTGWLGWAQPAPGVVRLGSETAPRRWIALDDALGAVLAALRSGELEGPLDAAHPVPVSSRALCALLRAGRPALRLPGRPWPPPTAPGGLPSLESLGYRFRHGSLEATLDHVLGRAGGTPTTLRA